jgi:signal transduction histidine kinase/CheY-like chemotaxis protein
MRFFDHLSIKRKMMVIIMIISSIALIASCAVFIGYEFVSYRNMLLRQQLTLAELASKNCVIFLELNMAGQLEKELSNFKADEQFISACVFNNEGVIWAKFSKATNQTEFTEKPTSTESYHRFDRNGLHIFMPIFDEDEGQSSQLGMFYLHASLSEMYARLRQHIFIVISLLVAGFLIVVLVASRLQKVITTPILSLSSAARCVSDKMDYSIRAPKYGNDEIGLLTDSFNEMLSQIQQRDADLSKSRQEAEEARQAAEKANKAKSTFLSHMSHEMRTPLAAIISALEPILPEVSKQGPALWSEFLSICYRQARHMLNQINDILDISRIEAGKMSVTLSEIEVKEIIEGGAMGGMPIFLRTNKNRFELECPDNLGVMRTDVDKVRRCLINLLANAGKFTKNGTVTLSVRRWPKNGADWLTFRVQDTGKGMTAEELARLFVPFSQASGSIGQKFGGHGLGLAITKELCQRLGGDVRVESEPGKGSCFIIDLPAESAEPRADQALNPPASPAPPQPSESGCVLVIDDDPEMQRLLSQVLEREGFRVEVASGGQEGLRRARELRPKAITLDVLMPDLDGWAVLSQLKADPDLAAVPVVMVTVWPEGERAFALGVVDYLTKPIDSRRLLATLRKYQLPHAGNHALVVEDDPDMCSLLRQALVTANWTATTAENGKAALEQIAHYRNTPSLIILDLMMPVMDGFEFIAELQKNEQWRKIPVVVVSAKDLTLEEKRRLDGQVTEILRKGAFSREELLQSVRHTVRQLLPEQDAPTARTPAGSSSPNQP